MYTKAPYTNPLLGQVKLADQRQSTSLTLGDLGVELQQGEELVWEELPGPGVLLQVEPVVDQPLPA